MKITFFRFLRQGKPGGYGAELNEEQIKRIDDWVESGAEKDIGFKFNM